MDKILGETELLWINWY